MPFSSRAVSISTKVALPSMVTSVRVGSALPSVVHLPIAGCHALIEQNGPIMAHTFAGGASTSMLFVTEAAPALMLKSAAEAIVVLIRISFTPLIALCRRAHAHSTTRTEPYRLLCDGLSRPARSEQTEDLTAPEWSLKGVPKLDYLG